MPGCRQKRPSTDEALPDHQDGEEGHHHVTGEGHQLADGQRLGDDLVPPDQVDEQCGHVRDGEDAREGQGEDPVHPDVHIVEGDVGISIAIRFVTLAHEGLDHPHAGKVLLQDRV